MSELVKQAGYCVGLGGTNARTAFCVGGDIMKFETEATPSDPPEFFAWMARQLLDSAHSGSEWMVAGFPGPVSSDGEMVGPMANVQGMKATTYDLKAELVAADSDVKNALNQGFRLIAVNDGTLAAQAAAVRIGECKFNSTAALIVGTGVGAGVVKRDPRIISDHCVFREDDSPLEIGHIAESIDPFDRIEDKYCGPGIEKRYGVASARELEDNHPAWQREGAVVARLSLMLGLMSGVELVVPTGGVGAGASHKYGSYAQDYLRRFREYGNGPQQKFTPELRLVPPSMCNEFEMYGAEAVMLAHATR